MEPGYVKGDSRNLPTIDIFSKHNFMERNRLYVQAECRGVKLEKSAGEDYGDDAVGYVQVKRDGDICTVKARIVPEHKIHNKPYHVSLVVKENGDNPEIQSVTCVSCIAGKGFCKHAYAFLSWIERRSHDKSCTSVEPYWKRPRLATVGNTPRTADEMHLSQKKLKRPVQIDQNNTNFLSKLIRLGTEHGSQCQILNHFKPIPIILLLSYHLLARDFLEMNLQTPDQFMAHCSSRYTQQSIREVEFLTREQSASNAWFKIRYGRITASKFYEAAHCTTPEGVLVETILGAKQKLFSKAMERGLKLEPQVIRIVSRTLKINLTRCGLFLNKNYPIYGASPDAIGAGVVVEVKSPSHDGTIKNYVNPTTNLPTPKFNAQMQLQMLMTGMKKAIFAVASPNFETDNNVSIYEVNYDEALTMELLKQSTKFWVECIFPKIIGKC